MRPATLVVIACSYKRMTPETGRLWRRLRSAFLAAFPTGEWKATDCISNSGGALVVAEAWIYLAGSNGTISGVHRLTGNQVATFCNGHRNGRRIPETFAAAHSPSGRFELGRLVHTSVQMVGNLFLKTTRGVLPVMVQGWGMVALAAACDGSIGRC